MKILHLADLHIGKRVNEYSMLEEQENALRQILAYIDERGVEAVLIAGDIYDRTVPLVAGVQLFDSFLTELHKRNLLVLMIAGNHDSAERISFCKSILTEQGFYIAGSCEKTLMRVTKTDGDGNINFYLMPYFKVQQISAFYPEVQTGTEAAARLIEETKVDFGERNILVAHQFVAGNGANPYRTDSETLFVGGTEEIDYHVMEGFDYVALGHLHGAQKVGSEAIRYAGSPVKYSFSEARHQKSVTLIHLFEKGNIQCEQLSIKPLHDMREIKGPAAELFAPQLVEAMSPEERMDYMHVTLTDDNVYDAIGMAKAVYPNVMQLDFDNTRTRNKSDGMKKAVEAKKKSTETLFRDFFQEQTGKELTNRQQEYVKQFTVRNDA